jgi:lycopene beta-cyclase
VTYAAFLAVFLAPPIMACVVWGFTRRRINRRLILALLATACMAVVYTAPWDNLLLAQSVWSYPPGRIIGVTLGLVPVEEYTFFVLQVILVGLLTALLQREHR